MIQDSSEELVSERYAVHAIPIDETNGCIELSILEANKKRRVLETHNLELNRNDSEVEKLHGRPQHEVGLERRQVYVPELLSQCSLASSFGNGHKGKETRQT